MSEWAFEIRAFACGNGDTILLKWPGPKWAVVDCCLPEKGGVREKVFAHFRQAGVKRLEFICLTHPDLDHLRGMAELVEHFTTADRSLGFFCHPPADPRTVGKVLQWIGTPHSRETRSEYGKLIEKLHPLFAEKVVARFPMHSRAENMDDGSGVVFAPMAPDPNTDWDLMIAGLKRLARRGAPIGDLAAGQVNAVSIVLAIALSTPKARMAIMLGGDLAWEEWPWALKTWLRRCPVLRSPPRFRIVKVAHHGSRTSHYPPLASAFAGPAPRFAVLSVGSVYLSHPDRRVLGDFRANDWRVFLTQKRLAKTADRTFLIEAFSATRRAFEFSQGRDLVLTVDQEGRIAAEPPEAVLQPGEVPLYEEALEPWPDPRDGTRWDDLVRQADEDGGKGSHAEKSAD